ncbi:MAG: 23S rRNA (adenine(2503)-C(2))-methyltransferase RlmN [Tissierellia bacterium]|nr:23S rRNA (adenine(2503)-C(2))-methyltransferase RlmN [Tissierellia bacterium]
MSCIGKKEHNFSPVNYSLEQWRLKMDEWNEKAFRGNQIYEYLHRSYGLGINEWNRLPKSLRDKLSELDIPKVVIEDKYVSDIDGTIKYLYKLYDDSYIEGVLMKYKYGYTLCVSTQVGCAMGCSFCASTKGGKQRDLEAYEILGQIYSVEIEEDISISHVVLMGMGEPLDNWDHVKRFMEILASKEGKNMSYRNMTVSTCGVVPGIEALAEWGKPVTLAISLHGTNDSERNEIMPINRKYPIDELMKTVDRYTNATGRRVSFEFTVIPGYNDSMESMDRLADLLSKKLCHVNLIPLNPIEEFNKGKQKSISIYKLADYLEKKNIQTSVRRTLGPDIDASCGQLRQRKVKGRN